MQTWLLGQRDSNEEIVGLYFGEILSHYWDTGIIPGHLVFTNGRHDAIWIGIDPKRLVLKLYTDFTSFNNKQTRIKGFIHMK